MTIRIDRITVSRDGPLTQDFELNCGDLNLIYGANETGKSYIVECLIRCLFRTSGRGIRNWSLRAWNPSASVSISGLSDKPLRLRPETSEKLDAVWQTDDTQYPNDLSRLLVVKEGETWLGDSAAQDGVGFDLLKQFLSGERLLDAVGSRIEKTLQSATLEHGKIVGDSRGDIKTRNKLQEALDDLDTLLDQCDSQYAQGRLKALEVERHQLQQTRVVLLDAKRYRAGSLATTLEQHQNLLSRMPAEADLGKLSQKINQHADSNREIETAAGEVTAHEQQIDDSDYIVRAIANYERVSERRGTRRGPQWLLAAALVFVILAIIGSLGDWTVAAAIFSGIAAVLLAGGLWSVGRSGVPDPAATEELHRLGDEFQRRFSEPLADLASLEARRDALQRSAVIARRKLEELDERRDQLVNGRRAINLELAELAGKTVDEQMWLECMATLSSQRGDVEQAIRERNDQLRDLGVPSSEYSADDPGQDWDVARYDRIDTQIDRIDDEIRMARQRLDTLRLEVISATQAGSDSGWQELLDALRTRRDSVASDYRGKTAEMLAKILVYKVIDEQREREKERIHRGLEDDAICQALQSCSGRYIHFGLADDNQLEVEDAAGNAFPVARLSTGAKEQVYLGLRIGFAARALGARAGFLILDDAFQHSDWRTRQRLVNQCVALVDRGWQIFYFAMDDHVRDLLVDAGQGLGDRFTSSALAVQRSASME